jgi:hypothetical protein
VSEFVLRYKGFFLMEDSLFGIVGSFRTKEGNWSEREDWRE